MLDWIVTHPILAVIMGLILFIPAILSIHMIGHIIAWTLLILFGAIVIAVTFAGILALFVLCLPIGLLLLLGWWIHKMWKRR